ncbi:MAG: IS66 family insertion sequence element accessory protein TnpB [Clostridia bacterium]|nr:IS66 family insertion sequence element accessory protein TnpB [Clostridia bacterium]
MLNNATGFKHIYIATGYTDLRKSIDGLAMLIHSEFNRSYFTMRMRLAHICRS